MSDRLFSTGWSLFMQCPNCGGYRVQKFEGAVKAGIGERLLCTLVTLSFFGTIFGLIWFLNIRERNAEWKAQQGDPWYEFGYRCRLCGYEWLQRLDEKPLINVNPNLIQMGEQRLEEEEDRRRDLLLH